MALFTPGPIVAEVRGSVGGQTFSRNRFGAYIRNRSVPVNPNSSRQQAIRNIMAFVVNFWSQQLGITQRDAWDVYAENITFTNSLGQSYKITGFNHFVRSNIARQIYGLSIVSDGPTVLILPPTDADFATEISEASQLITVTFDDTQPWAGENSASMSIHQGIPQNSARSFYGNNFRLLGILSGSASSSLTSPQTIAVDRPVAEGQRNWTFGRIQRADSRISVPFRHDVVIGA